MTKSLRLIIAVTLLVLTGRVFDAEAETVTNLHSFGSAPTDGAHPEPVLMQGSDGNFYGTTQFGGADNDGTVFRISPSGSETNLHSFGSSPNDGSQPQAGLVQANDGNFYGTTQVGGTTGRGTVFRISSSGSYTSLYSFAGPPTDGSLPLAGLLQGSDGNLYGTTAQGGTKCPTCGTVFRISPSGSYASLHSFAGPPNDGYQPFAPLVQASDGNLYGTTEGGGPTNGCPDGCGTVYRISPGGSYTNLFSFNVFPASFPVAGLVQGSDGNLYGTTSAGGAHNSGTVFRLSLSGAFTTLHSFVGAPTDGAYPAGLAQGSDGNFYGTTDQGGTNTSCHDGCGTVFRVSTSGSYTNLYSFPGQLNAGYIQQAGVAQASDGSFYGTTGGGGTSSKGTVFKLTVPLNPPANQISAIGLVVTNILFAVPSVAGETYQLQFTTDLTSGSWSNIPGVSVTNSIGSLLTLTNFGGALLPQGFYRFAITP